MEPMLNLAQASWRFAHPQWLALLLLAPTAMLALWLSDRRRRAGLTRFVGDTALGRLPRRSATWARAGMVAIGAGSLAIAAARPQSDPVTEQVAVRGRDLVFVIDVSRSMLSRDVAPDRLERTKLWINDLVNTLGGDRVGLVAFAGVPVVKCPLTLDHGFFRMELEELSPASAPRGGTLIGDAIRKAMSDVFEPGRGRHRDIILFTDGEDQGSFPVEAAKAAGEAGVRIIAIGIGSELEGAFVPAEQTATDRYVEHEGSRVRSKLDGTTLAAIAQAAREAGGRGVFLNVGTGTIDLDTVYRDLIASAERTETSQLASVSYRELFPLFLGVALACLALETLIPSVRRPRAARSAVPPRGAFAAVLVLGGLLLSSRAVAAEPETDLAPPSAADTYNEGRRLFLEGKHAEAAERFRSADLSTRETSLASAARYNLGQALYRQAFAPSAGETQSEPSSLSAEQRLSLLDAATRAFRSALEIDPADREAARNVELCRRRMQEIREEEERRKQQQGDQQSKSDPSDGQQGQSPDSKGKAGDHDAKSKELSDLAKRQREAAEQTSKADASSDRSERTERTEEAKESQKRVGDDTKRQQESPKQPTEAAKDQLEKARQEQQRASEALERGDLDEARRRQEQAAEHLESAAESERQAAERARGANPAPNAKPRESESKQPAYDQTASQLLDRERRLREARRQAFRAMRGTPQPVERDW